MVKKKNPRHGSMQFWPRKRSKKSVARIRSWKVSKDPKPLGFMGYKVGMAHVMGTETKGKVTTTYRIPVTIIECPPVKIFSIRFYKDNQVATEIQAPKLDKELSKKINVSKQPKKIDDINTDYDHIRVLLYSQPKMTAIGKKKPDIFEMKLGGTKEDQLNWAKENMDKEINVKDILDENSQVDIHAITTGKGYQGVIKRFGVNLRSHKAEKGQRRVGARSGGWSAQAHMMFRVAQPGKMGYHTRTEYNKVIIKIMDEVPTSFERYGKVNNNCLIIKGSVAGPRKRAIQLVQAIRPNKKYQKSSIIFDKVIL